LSIEIKEHALKKACLEMIETIILCLPNAFKGTIYRVGKPPDLIVERITSGVISEDRKKITWGLPAQSEYNPPGRPWLNYRDEPGRPMEAMAWCVEKQRSWTAEDPTNDIRSVRLQMDVGLEDFQHMEPVLARKSDLNLNMYSSFEYPIDCHGHQIWRDSEYVVVAVIKIHFRPYTIKIGSHETRVIKKLSRSLGTELLSYHLHQNSMKAMQQMAQDRLNACDILADSLRNAIMKSGLIFSLMKQEIGYLRDQWETALMQECQGESIKATCIEALNSMLSDLEDVDEGIKRNLMNIQEKFLDLSLTPEQGKRWVNMQIEGRWNDILCQYPQHESRRFIIWQEIDRLKKSLQFGQDLNILANYHRMPEALTREWVDIIYCNLESFDPYFLDRLINVLDNPILDIPSRERSRKSLIQLKALAETMNQLERNTNFLLHQVLNGSHGKNVINNLHHLITHTPIKERPLQSRSRI
jgi:hypothetical protein